MKNSGQNIEIREELQRIYEENALMRTLGTRTGFFQYYFDQLKNHRTQFECFNAVNEKHFDLFGEFRYDSYDSFRKQFNKSVHLLD